MVTAGMRAGAAIRSGAASAISNTTGFARGIFSGLCRKGSDTRAKAGSVANIGRQAGHGHRRHEAGRGH